MTYQEKNEGKEGALRAARLSFQECIWLGLMSRQRSAVAGAPALFRGPREEIGVRGETGSPGPGFDRTVSLERVYV